MTSYFGYRIEFCMPISTLYINKVIGKDRIRMLIISVLIDLSKEKNTGSVLENSSMRVYMYLNKKISFLSSKKLYRN